MGCRRECSRSRAVALMSVLDVFDWHERAVEKNNKPPEEKGLLIREGYFYQFIQEAAPKIGPQFYNFISDAIDDVDAFMANPVFGTMMPFSVPMGDQFEKEGSNQFMPVAVVKGHPDVVSWGITSNGQVKISRAGILAYVDVAGRPIFDKSLRMVRFSMVPYLSGIQGFTLIKDILNQVSTVKDQPDRYRPSYIVSLFLHEPSGLHFCTLLQGRGRARAGDDCTTESGHLELVRRALLHSERWVDLPPPTVVDWTVL